MSTYSRVRASGAGNGWPYQPSTTWGPETPPLGARAPPRERRQRVRAVGLGGPDRVVAQPLGLQHELLRVGRRSRAPVPQLQTDLHVLHTQLLSKSLGRALRPSR